MTVLSVSCPHCLQGNEDPVEVMARGEVDWTNCGACNRRFLFLLAVCEHCTEESVFAWREAPAPAETQQLRCQTCGRGLEWPDEALAEDHSRRI